MSHTTVRINVDKKAWKELKLIVFNLLNMNPKLADINDISDSQTSIYLLKILDKSIKEGIKIVNEEKEDPNLGFTREF